MISLFADPLGYNNVCTGRSSQLQFDYVSKRQTSFSRDGEKISMTAPVMQSLGEKEDQWIVSFSMPSKYNKKNLPEPNNETIYTETLEPIMTAVIRFAGKTDKNSLLIKEKM